MNIEKIVNDNFRGCVLICQNGKTVFQKVQGYADYPNKVPNEYETKFATASAGKVFWQLEYYS